MRDIRSMIEQIGNPKLDYEQYQVVTDSHTQRSSEVKHSSLRIMVEVLQTTYSQSTLLKNYPCRLADRGVIALPPMAEVVSTSNNRSYIKKTYTFSGEKGKRDSINKGVIIQPHGVGEKGKRDSIIVVAQLSPEFTAALVAMEFS